MSPAAERNVGRAIALLTVATGGGQLLFAERALATLGLPVDDGSTLLFRLLSLMVLLFGLLIWHDLSTEEGGRRGVLWGGLQKIGASTLLLIALLADHLAPLVWGVVVWDASSGIFLVWLSRREKDSVR